MSYGRNYYSREIDTLINTIDHNAATKPKPFHHNFDLMTATLKMELGHDIPSGIHHRNTNPDNANLHSNRGMK